ncbi:hypothetical protein M426DRAFT_8728 [Hypoxylon sp. CI-4A]|nr:hypothetical protein M426DRAFT_8728 [Hypoxylon sp. CI-4A]
MDYSKRHAQPSSNGNGAIRWTNSRLNRRDPVSSEQDSDGSEGGARLYPRLGANNPVPTHQLGTQAPVGNGLTEDQQRLVRSPSEELHNYARPTPTHATSLSAGSSVGFQHRGYASSSSPSSAGSSDSSSSSKVEVLSRDGNNKVVSYFVDSTVLASVLSQQDLAKAAVPKKKKKSNGSGRKSITPPSLSSIAEVDELEGASMTGATQSPAGPETLRHGWTPFGTQGTEFLPGATSHPAQSGAESRSSSLSPREKEQQNDMLFSMLRSFGNGGAVTSPRSNADAAEMMPQAQGHGANNLLGVPAPIGSGPMGQGFKTPTKRVGHGPSPLATTRTRGQQNGPQSAPAGKQVQEQKRGIVFEDIIKKLAISSAARTNGQDIAQQEAAFNQPETTPSRGRKLAPIGTPRVATPQEAPQPAVQRQQRQQQPTLPHQRPAIQPQQPAVVQHQQPVASNGIVLHQQASQYELSPLEFIPPTAWLQQQRSYMLNGLVGPYGQPSIKDIMDPAMMPFTEIWSAHQENRFGVVCLGNIPYGVTRAEVIAFLGRSARLPNDKHEPVHIIMDRTTSKTMDCYVEFLTTQDAMNAVNKHQNAVEAGRHPRIGQRLVDVTLSSQDRLMEQLFPCAKGVDFSVEPYGITTDSRFAWENFRGFITEEEMTMLYKHGQTPAHSPFSMNCPERPFEAMISCMKKLPWHMPEHITIKQRHCVYNAAITMINSLRIHVNKPNETHLSAGARKRAEDNALRLTPQVLNRLVKAALSCPGFTVVQKGNIAYTAGMSESEMQQNNLPPNHPMWTHLYALGPKADAYMDVVEYYVALIRGDTNRCGFFWREVNYPNGAKFDNMTLAEAAQTEWNAIERCLRRAVDGGDIPEY